MKGDTLVGNAPGEDVHFDPREFARVLLKRKWLILGMTLFTGAVTLMVTLSMKPKYEAACTLEYDPNPPRPLGHDVEDIADPIGSYWTTKDWYETQNRIIASYALAEVVAREHHLERDPDFFHIPEDERDGWEGTVDRAASLLQSRVEVKQIEGTRVVVVTVTDTSPARAQTLANAIAEAYMERSRESRLSSTISALTWLSEQLSTLQGQLDSAERDLHQFKADHNVLSMDLNDQQSLIATEIQQYAAALADANTKRIELAARLRLLQAANRDDPFMVRSPAVLADPAIEGLRRQHQERLAERAALSERYGPSHPEIRSLDLALEELTGQMREAIDGLLASAEFQLREVQQTEAGLRAALNQANQAGLELNLHEIEYNRLNRERENKSKLYGVVLARTAETDLTRMLRVNYVRVIDRARLPEKPVSPRLALNMAGGVFAGLLLGLFLAVAAARMDRSIRSVDDVEALEVPLLGVVPNIVSEDAPLRPKRARGRLATTPATSRDLIVHSHPMSAVAECCRTVRTNLRFMTADRKASAILVTSPSPLEGKTTIAISLAISLAQAGKRILLVDTDLRRPRLHRAFGLPGRRGLTSVLGDEASLAQVVQETKVPNLSLLVAGPIPPNPSELLHTARFAALLEVIRESYDQVVFDSPPLTAVTDAAVLAPQLDGVVVVVKAGQTSRDAARAVVGQLRDISAQILGIVLNDIDISDGRYGYGAYYYNRDGYYTEPSDEDDDSGARPAHHSA